MKNSKIIIIIIVGVAVALGAGAVDLLREDSERKDGSGFGTMTDSEWTLQGTVMIGHLVPITGGLSQFGADGKAAVDIAVDDYNEYLDEQGVEWDIGVIHDDTESVTTGILDRLIELEEQGVKVVIGPYTSANVSALSEYAEANRIVMISPSSSAPQLAIADDGIFRIPPDDRHRATTLGQIMADAGIQSLVVINRDDTWGNGMYEAVKETLEQDGKSVAEPIIYEPDTSVEQHVSLLANMVQDIVSQSGTTGIGVLVAGFDETPNILEEASNYSVLADVKWFCPDTFTAGQQVIENAIAREFAINVEFTCLELDTSSTPIRADITSRLEAVLGQAPGPFAHFSYDGLLIAAGAILETKGLDADEISEVIPKVASMSNGSTGNTMLNESGDRVSASFKVQSVEGGQWVDGTTYESSPVEPYN